MNDSDLKIVKRVCEFFGYTDYDSYLDSPNWKFTKERFFRDCGRLHRLKKYFDFYVCELCHKINGKLDIHHITYKRFGNERLTDLLLVCHPCHGEIHEFQKKKKGTPVLHATSKISKKKGGLIVQANGVLVEPKILKNPNLKDQ